jgi:hypothetical protein
MEDREEKCEHCGTVMIPDHQCDGTHEHLEIEKKNEERGTQTNDSLVLTNCKLGKVRFEDGLCPKGCLEECFYSLPKGYHWIPEDELAVNTRTFRKVREQYPAPRLVKG